MPSASARHHRTVTRTPRIRKHAIVSHSTWYKMSVRPAAFASITARSQPLLPLPPPLGLTPRSLFLRGHPPRDVAPRQRQQRHSQPLAELHPDRGPLRHEGCTCTKVYGGGDGVMLLSLSVTSSGSSANFIGSGGQRSRMYRRAARLPAYQNFSSRSLPPLAHGFSLFLSRRSLNHSSPCPRLSA